MDIVGQHPETYAGNRYTLVISEYATRHMIAVAMKDQTAKTVEKKNVILKYERPPQKLTAQKKSYAKPNERHLHTPSHETSFQILS